MNNMNKNVFKVFSAWAFAMLFYLVPNLSYGQTFDVDVVGSSDPAEQLIVNDDDLTVRIENIAGFTSGNMFYVYYNNSNDVNVIQEENVLVSQSYPANLPPTRTYVSTMPEVGFWDVFVGQWNGRFDYFNQFGSQNIDEVFGTTNNNFPFNFNQAGSRKLITNPYSLVGEIAADIEVQVDYTLISNTANGFEFQWSTNGTTWNSLIDQNSGESLIIIDNNNYFAGAGTASFELPIAAMNANTQFRIRQQNTLSIQEGLQTFAITAIRVLKGAPMTLVYGEPVGNFHVILDPGPNGGGPQSINIVSIIDSNTDNVWFDNGGVQVDLGETVTITAETQNITLADYEFFVEFDGVDYLIPAADLTRDQINNEVTIDFTVPVQNPIAINDTRTVRVKVVDGTTIVPPSLALNEDLVVDAQTLLGGNVIASAVEFELAGAREVTSEAYNIASLDGIEISFYLARLSGTNPAPGNEIVFEYTTNGTTWNIIETIELGGANGVGLAGQWFTFNEDSASIAGIASANTQFRIRQLNASNGTNINSWYLEDFELTQTGDAGNVLDIPFNLGTLRFNEVSFDIEFADLNVGPLFPGSVVEVEVSNLSEFVPTGTVYEFFLKAGHGQTGSDDTYLLASIDAADFDGTIALEMPFVSGPHSLIARAIYGRGLSSSSAMNLTIQPISIELTDFTFDYTDNGDNFNVSGNDITVDFDLTGTPVVSGDLSLSVILEIQDQFGVWSSIGSLELTTAIINAGNGSITGQLPAVGINEGNRNIRLRLENVAEDNNSYFRRHNFVSINQLNSAGPRSATLWVDSDGSETFVTPQLFIQNASLDQEVYLQRWNGSWSTVATYEIQSGFTGYLSQIHNLADTVSFMNFIPGWNQFRIYYNENGEAAAGENVLWASGISSSRAHVVTNNSSNIDFIRLRYPTLELSQLEAEYYFGEEITVQYETTNIDATADLWFALVLEQGSIYHVLNESQDLNNVDLNVTFPTEAELEAKGFDTNDSCDVRIYTYKQDDYDSLIIASFSENFNAINDAVAISGNTGSTFNQSGDRYAISPAFDLSDWIGDITLSFLYSANISVVNAHTLPKLEYSIDGGITYSELTVDASPYANINRLPAVAGMWTSLSVDIPAVSEDVRFRWSQEVATGTWSIWNVDVVAGDDNRFNGFNIIRINMPQSIDLIEEPAFDYSVYNSFGDYTWTLVDEDEDLDPMITIGEDFDFTWLVDTTGLVFPEGTSFEFFIVDGNLNNEEDYVHFATVTDTGAFEGNISNMDVVTNLYNVYARAYIIEAGDTMWIFPADNNANPVELTYPLVQVATNVLVVNETTDAEVNDITINAPNNNATIEISELFDVTYTTLGNFPAGVEFAVVLREPTTGEYEVLATGSDFGTSITVEDVQMIAQAWLRDNGDITLDYELGVVAYEGTELVLANVEIELDEEDMIVLLGENNNLYFEEEGDRVALTRALDLSDLVDPVLEFNYWANNITMSTNTLPRLEVSIDGGATFDAVEIDDALGAQGYLAANGFVSYSVAIDPAYVTAATHFRWSQAINNGAGSDEWEIWDIEIVSGTSNVYVNKGNAIKAWIDVELVAPTLANYNWSLVTDANGFEPTIFNGGEFDFEWELEEDELAFPVGTEINFVIFYGGQPHVIATIDAEGVHTAEVPFLVERNSYNVYAVDSYYGTAIEDASFQVGTINVYNEVVRTVYVPANNNLFAGSQVTFEANLENTVNPSDYDDVWFNLVVWDGSDWWLLAAQEGIVNQFVVDLPPFLNGNRTFEIRPSLDGPIAVVGEKLSGAGAVIADAGGNIGGANGAVGSYTLGDEDLTDYVTLSFELDIQEELANLTADQLINLEYSVDNGQTFTLVASYPDARFNDPSFFTNDDWFMEEINLDANMQQEDVIFRWRVEETNGSSAVRNIEFTPVSLDYTNVMSLVKESTNVNILPQRVDITGTDAFEYCLDGTVQMNYQIRGVFGAEAVVALEVDNGGWQAVEVNGEAVEFTGITSGNGTVALDLANVTSNNLGSGIFRLVVEDETVEDYEFTINGNQNAVAIAIVPTFDTDTDFATSSISICEGNEVTVTIEDAQEHFAYQLRDYITGALVGPEVIAEGTEVEIELGAISDNWTLEMLITARTENGLVCGTRVPNYQFEIDVREESALYWNNDGEWTLVGGTEQLVACTNTWTIAVGYYDNNGDFVAIDADFYRNNANAELANQEDEYVLPAVVGNYFAMYEDCEGNMVQTSSVEVIEAYPTPEITVPATASCDADFIELTAPAGFAYYEWRRNGVVFNANNEASVTVTQGGDYEVRVSNTDIDMYGCASEWSDEVTITMEDAYRALVFVDGAWDAVFAGQEVSVCGTVRLGYNNSTSSFSPSVANANILWYRNGVALQGVSTNNFVVTQPGTYQARYVSDNCDYVMEEIVVDFDNVPATPVVAVNGPTDFCEGESSLTLVAPAGFASYEWRRNGGTVVNTASNANEFEVSASGTYTVRVETANGCQSLWSTGVTATVHTLPAVHAATIADVELCEAGEVTVLVPLVENDVMYQLFDVVTGQASGAARMGTTNANLVLTSDEIESTTMLEVRAYRLNAQDCEAVSQPFEVTVFEMSITASGNTLIANVNNDVNATYQWYRNGVMITNGGNNPTLDIYDDADYFVVVSTSNGCTLEDGFGKAKGADIDEDFGMTVNVFPNPATVDVNVHYTSATEENLTITVVSVEGKVVYQASDVKTEGTFEHVIPVSNLTSGTYMIHINGTESQLVNKFIKQ